MTILIFLNQKKYEKDEDWYTVKAYMDWFLCSKVFLKKTTYGRWHSAPKERFAFYLVLLDEWKQNLFIWMSLKTGCQTLDVMKSHKR